VVTPLAGEVIVIVGVAIVKLPVVAVTLVSAVQLARILAFDVGGLVTVQL
jgi:hypothetical protein